MATHCMVCEHPYAAHDAAGRCSLCLECEYYRMHTYAGVPAPTVIKTGPSNRLLGWTILWVLAGLAALTVIAMVFG